MQRFNFYRHESQQWEKVDKEAWEWTANYSDNTLLHQFERNTLRFHQFKEIDQSRLKSFTMFNEELDRRVTILFNPENMKLVHFYRHIRLNDGQVIIKVYFFGIEQKLGGETFKNLFAIMPDQEIIACENEDLISKMVWEAFNNG